jgi:transcriptional regulator with XRE-family HTH domain
MEKTNKPFIGLGGALRELREKNRKTPAEVSGAIEVEVDRLLSFEAGDSRPSEDILLLIIQHFDLADKEARKLWKLAGYKTSFDGEFIFDDESLEQESQLTKTIAVSPQDIRIVYTDMLQVSINNYGVVMNFLQSSGIGNQPLAISRVGMSVQHAKSVIEVLTKTLEQAEEKNAHSKSPKRLSSSSQE